MKAIRSSFKSGFLALKRGFLNMSRLEKVFVYGTLKSGEPNHGWIIDTSKGFSKFLCKAETVEKYPLIIASRYNIPFLLDLPGCGHNVVGELYEVDEPMLKHLDVLEEHPTFYIREQREVQKNEDTEENKVTEAWIYFIKTYRQDLLEEPLMKNYSSKGKHGKPYSERKVRDPSYSVKSDIEGTE